MENIGLEQIYHEYKSRIYTLCLRLTMSKDFADDLFSDTWVRVAEKFDQLDQNQGTLNWVYTICLNLYRKQKLKRSLIYFFSDKSEYQDVATDSANAEELSIEKEEILQLQRALHKLSDKYRIPITLFYFKDLSYQDISEIMKIPLSSVKFRLNQAKKLLKKEIEK